MHCTLIHYLHVFCFLASSEGGFEAQERGDHVPTEAAGRRPTEVGAGDL